MKRGQVAIFVIVAVIIIGAIALVFFIRNFSSISTQQDFNLQAFIGQCIRPELESGIDVLFSQGGFINPKDYVIYNDRKVPYLCKNINYYEKCIMQHPNYVNDVREELYSEIREKIPGCFDQAKAELERRGYSVSMGDISANLTLKPGVVELEMESEVVYSKGDSSVKNDNYAVRIKNRIYDMAVVGQEIARQEAQFCYFENLGFNLLYREIEVNKGLRSDSTKIYIIEDKESGKNMMVAIRGCVIPAGF